MRGISYALLQLADEVGLLGYLLTDSVNFDEMGQCIPN